MAGGVRQEIERRVGEFEAAFNRGDVAALAVLYAEDAVLMPPDTATITGRPEIQRFWQGVREAGVTRVSLHPQQVTGNGDVAVEVSTADLTAESGDSQAGVTRVKYVVVWRRHGGGPWQLAVDIWNGRPAD